MRRSFFPAIVFLCSTMLNAQVIIKEKVEITPNPPAAARQVAESPSSSVPLFRFGSTGYYDFASTTIPGVVVSGSVGSFPTEIPIGTRMEVYVTTAYASHLVFQASRLCDMDAATVVQTFRLPSTVIESCPGRVSAGGTVWYPWYAMCQHLSYSRNARATVSGNSATLTVPSFTGYSDVVINITGSVDPSFQLNSLEVTPSAPELNCSGSASVTVKALDGRGKPYVVCEGTTMVTASLQAKGEYAYLVAGGLTGASVTFPLSQGRGVLSCGLRFLERDYSKGI